MSTLENQGVNETPNFNNLRNSYTLSTQSEILLVTIGNQKVYVDDIITPLFGKKDVDIEESKKQEYDDALAQLLFLNLVTTMPDSSLVLTPTGRKALGERIALVYPMGVESTARGYNDTLSTQTKNAGNALLYAICNHNRWLGERDTRSLNALFNSLISNQIPYRISANSAAQMSDICLQRVNNDAQFSKNTNSSLVFCTSIVQNTRSILINNIKNQIFGINVLKLNKEVLLNESAIIKEVSVSENGELLVNTQSLYEIDDNNVNEVSIYDLPIETLISVVDSI
jgi:hypothetical protein